MMDINELWLAISQDGEKAVAVKPENGIVLEGTMGEVVFHLEDVHPAYHNLFLSAPAMRVELVNAYNILTLMTDECGQMMSPAIFDTMKSLQNSFLMRIIHVDKGIDEAANALRAELEMKAKRSSPQ